MLGFIVCLEQNNTSINLHEFELEIQKEVHGLIEDIKEKHEQAKSFDPSSFVKQIEFHFQDYPNIKNLLKAILSKNPRYILDQLAKARAWVTQKPYKQSEVQRTVLRKTWTYMDSLNLKDSFHSEAEIHEIARKAIHETQLNMEKIKDLVNKALQNIKWNGTSITVKAVYEKGNNEILKPATTSEIVLGASEFNPSFTLFYHEDKVEIDDVLEGGDEDFFKDQNTQVDYFNLVNKLRNPGSKEKILTLYTARPKKDRDQFLHSNIIPLNIFLTNNYDHAEGLGDDLGGNRDVWKVRISNKYLTQTLQGDIKYYQVTVPNAKAELQLLTV